MTDMQSKIAALPKRKGSDDPTAWCDAEEVIWYAARLALAREWIDTRVPHLEGCPWRGLTRDTQGLLPDCRCGRDALLAAIEVPHE